MTSRINDKPNDKDTMRQTSYTTRVLRADEGRYLTQADPTLPDSARVVTDTVYLAANDDPAAWKEITADEAGRINAARQSGETANDKTDE